MGGEDERWNWHDQRGITWAAGAAAVALIVLLVVAVIRTSNGSPLLPDFGPSVPSQATVEETPATRTTSATTSYSRPSVQTTELNPAPAPAPSTEEPSADEPTPTTSTTIDNPYGTTTPTNAGHV